MGVPAHDQRDFDFAKKYDIPIVPVIEPEDKNIDVNNLKKAFINEGNMMNYSEDDGMSNEDFKKKIFL